MSENTHNNAPPPPVSGRWKPGQSGNPGGRPKKKPISDGLVRLFAKLKDQELEEFNREIVQKAAGGDVSAWEKVTDRLEGKVSPSTEELEAIKGFAWLDPTTKE